MKILVVGSDDYATPWRHAIPDAEIVCQHATQFNEDVLGRFAAVQFCGGTDINARLYGDKPLFPSDDARDLAEVRLFMEADRYSIPMFGICRGSQFLRAMCGGALYQDILHHGINGHHPAFVDNRHFKMANGPMTFGVSSTHHQAAIADPEGIRFKDILIGHNNGVDTVEGWVSLRHRAIAVQYHPEYMEPTSSGFQFYQDLILYGMGRAPITYGLR